MSANNDNSNNENQNIQLTNEQFQQLLNQNQSLEKNKNSNKEGLLKKTKDKTINSLDTGTRGMDGSVFSIMRWVVSFVKDMIDGIQEYLRMRRQNKNNDKGDE